MRRALALLGFMIVLALAAALLWRVYVHHMHAEPYVEEPSIVRLDAGSATSVITASLHS